MDPITMSLAGAGIQLASSYIGDIFGGKPKRPELDASYYTSNIDQIAQTLNSGEAAEKQASYNAGRAQRAANMAVDNMNNAAPDAPLQARVGAANQLYSQAGDQAIQGNIAANQQVRQDKLAAAKLFDESRMFKMQREQVLHAYDSQASPGEQFMRVMGGTLVGSGIAGVTDEIFKKNSKKYAIPPQQPQNQQGQGQQQVIQPQQTQQQVVNPALTSVNQQTAAAAGGTYGPPVPPWFTGVPFANQPPYQAPLSTVPQMPNFAPQPKFDPLNWFSLNHGGRAY